MSNPIKMWEAYPEFWKTESAFLSFIRGGIRRHLWSKNPVKLQFMKENRVKMVNTNPRSMKAHPTVWGFKCEQCLKTFAGGNCEVDHKTGEHSLKTVTDIQKFVEGVVFVRKEDLALLCKPCHKVKTHAERYGLSIREAMAQKQAIEKNKESVKNVVAFLTEHGYNAASTKEKRREQLVDHFMKRNV
jgi:5-methylcytosine-specific restriction endonuclease McrA